MLPSLKKNSVFLFLCIFLAAGVRLDPVNASASQLFQVKDISPSNLAAYQNQLLFLADDSVHGRELWKSDGTPDGTGMVKDINPGTGEIYASLLNSAVLNGSLYFTTDPDDLGPHGDELWRTDGSEQGTQPVKTFEFLALYPHLQEFTIFQGSLYFLTLYSADARVILWKTDGSQAGTLEVQSFPTGAYRVDRAYLTALDDRLIVNLAYTSENSPRYYELWSSDGTSGGTTRYLKMDNTFDDYPACHDTRPVKAGNLVFFCATQLDQYGYIEYDGAVFLTDGTATGTHVVTEEGKTTWPERFNQPAVLNGTVYFNGRNQVGYLNFTMWKVSPGSTSATQVKDFGQDMVNSPSNMIAGNNQIFFYANDGSSRRVLWRSDGTPTGTIPLKPSAAPYTPIDDFGCVFFGQFYFMATDPTHGYGLWSSDGTPENTRLIAAISGPTYYYYPELTAAYDTLFFKANDSTQSRALWAYQPYGQLSHHRFLPQVVH